MDTTVQIRPFAPGDHEAVLRLIELNTPAFFSAIEKIDLNHYLENEVEDYFVLTVENRIVGSGGINYLRQGTVAMISWDIIHPEWQGRGLGTQLLEHRFNILAKRGNIDKITVRTSQHTYGFYEKSGFKLLDTVKNYWADGFDLYSMVYQGQL